MNIEETKECIRVMQAFVDGKQVISLYAPAVTADDPYWTWGNDTKNYRIKPTAKVRPWTADEVPLGAWMRDVSKQDYRWLIFTSGNDDIRKNWLTECEHSIDNGKTWLPCGVVEEAK